VEKDVGIHCDKLRLSDMSWPDVRDAVRRGVRTVIIPIGSTEQHGPHLPLSTDSLIGDEIALRVAILLGDTLVAPTICLGVSSHHISFAGTLSISEDVLVEVLVQSCGCVARHGFSRVALMPSHGGNCGAIRRAVERAAHSIPNVQVAGFADVIGFFEPWLRVGAEAGVSPEEVGPHAGEAETSIMLALHPELVRMNAARIGALMEIEEARDRVFAQGHGVEFISQDGVVGDPTRADGDRGRRYVQAMADMFARYFRSAFSSPGD
jgi:creatinine amidohydrolase